MSVYPVISMDRSVGPAGLSAYAFRQIPRGDPDDTASVTTEGTNGRRRARFVRCMGSSCPRCQAFVGSKSRFAAGGGVDLALIHISEPTRRTPISYAVFCLKK